MKVDGKNMRPIWYDPADDRVRVIDQRKLPHNLVEKTLDNLDDVVAAISDMVVRGAPLIGVTGAYGLFIAARNAGARASDNSVLIHAAEVLRTVRPTATNLCWAVDRVLGVILGCDTATQRIIAAREKAGEIAELEVENSRQIGVHGLPIIEEIAAARQGEPVNILTHCNAGWLAAIEYGTALAPIYAAFEKNISVHVWVDETRPLNQGSRLTAWELLQAGVPHTVIADNAGGHLMQHGMVDLVIVGSDRTTASGDVANKIGTYLKALAAHDNKVPFYVALPSSTIDWDITDGFTQIPIEERDPDELRYMPGGQRSVNTILTPESSPAANFAFDVTPARLVTGLITEKGVCRANADDIRKMFERV
ncbi:MAG: S-methyl-5-thioribose-1-phosphate isomerase [Deltaproteobacteria bacterium]|nr:S-methyl-5-thioribose-1-phosphate isomerase [Deltaproteobacteria bacterium]